MPEASAPLARLNWRSVRVTPRTVWTFVEAHDSAGIGGVGEATLEGRHDDVERALARLAPPLVGQSMDGAAAAQWAATMLSPGLDLALAAAASAIEQALQDMSAQRTERPLHEALGAARRSRVPLYANINRGTNTRAPAQFAERAARAAAQGFAGVKIAPFDDVTPARCSDGSAHDALEAGLRRVAAASAVLPRGTMLMVDCHWRLDESTADTMVDELAALGVGWYECPLPESPGFHAAIRRLRGRANDAGMLLAGAETMVGRAGFAPLLRAGLYDVVMPDVKYAGGLAQTLAIAEDARAHGIDCSPHNPSGPICHAHSLHVAAVIERLPMLEVQFDETPLFQALAGPGLPAFEHGASRVPDGAGLGVRLSPTHRPITE